MYNIKWKTINLKPHNLRLYWVWLFLLSFCINYVFIIFFYANNLFNPELHAWGNLITTINSLVSGDNFNARCSHKVYIICMQRCGFKFVIHWQLPQAFKSKWIQNFMSAPLILCYLEAVAHNIAWSMGIVCSQNSCKLFFQFCLCQFKLVVWLDKLFWLNN